jgi:2'-5' RNA ligase superfamily
MTTMQDSAQWGSLALVSYIPDPLGSFLHSLRLLLPGEETPQAHLTILPPRPLRLPLEAALQRAASILDQFSGFEVTLSGVECFPGTKILYLGVSHGSAAIHELHTALNSAGLEDDEIFEFRPHLTIGGPVPEGQMKAVKLQAEAALRASKYSSAFMLEEVVGLWSRSTVPIDDWQRTWSYRLKPAALSAAP